MAAIIVLRNRNDTTHKENALVEQRKNGTALVTGAIPPKLKLLPYHRILWISLVLYPNSVIKTAWLFNDHFL